jgi:hypothetical protein
VQTVRGVFGSAAGDVPPSPEDEKKMKKNEKLT